MIITDARFKDPLVNLLFDIVRRNPVIDAETINQAKQIIQTIVEIAEFTKNKYEKLSHDLGKEIKFENIGLDIRNDSGATILTVASLSGHAEIVGFLLDNNADPNLAGQWGFTPLNWAARSGDHDCMLLLLQHRAKPDLENNVSGSTSLCYAAENGHTECMRLLLEFGAQLELANKKSGMTPLCYAARNNRAESLRFLLENKANPDLFNRLTGSSPLHYASSRNYIECVRLLLQHKATPDFVDEKSGATSLLLAAENGHTEVVSLLLEYGANPKLADEQTGNTPLRMAACYHHLECVQLLLRAGAKDLPNKDGMTVLEHVITLADNKDILERVRVIALLLKTNPIIKHPTLLLFNILTKCDPRHPDVLFVLNRLWEQQNLFRVQPVPNVERLENKEYADLNNFHKQLSTVSQHFQMSPELLRKTECQLPDNVLNIVCEFDVPLFRLKDSDTLFSKQDDITGVHQDLAVKQKELHPPSLWKRIFK